jgi:hypothetical protein
MLNLSLPRLIPGFLDLLDGGGGGSADGVGGMGAGGDGFGADSGSSFGAGGGDLDAGDGGFGTGGDGGGKPSLQKLLHKVEGAAGGAVGIVRVCAAMGGLR